MVRNLTKIATQLSVQLLWGKQTANKPIIKQILLIVRKQKALTEKNLQPSKENYESWERNDIFK